MIRRIWNTDIDNNIKYRDILILHRHRQSCRRSHKHRRFQRDGNDTANAEYKNIDNDIDRAADTDIFVSTDKDEHDASCIHSHAKYNNVYVHMHKCEHMLTWCARAHTHMHMQTHAYIHAHAHAYHAYAHVHTHAHVYLYICKSISIIYFLLSRSFLQMPTFAIFWTL